MFKLSKWIRGTGLSVLIVCTILAMALPASASQIAGNTNGRPESPQVATAPTLGLAAGYAVLGASAITNTGNSVINGNLGLSPGTSVTGFPPGIVNGTQHVTDTAAARSLGHHSVTRWWFQNTVMSEN
jgi:hypothetical protein